MSTLSLLLRRRQANKKPYDAEVLYLTSTGNQWIDTGITINSEYRIEVEVIVNAGSETVYGARIGLKKQEHAIVTESGGQTSYRARKTTTTASGVGLVRFDLNYETLCHLVARGGFIYVTQNDVTQEFYVQSYDSFTNNNLTYYLFGMNNNGSVSGANPKTIYSFKIYDENDTPILDLIPVRKGNTGYMYDRVSRQLFGNAGTGDFILGPDVQ